MCAIPMLMAGLTIAKGVMDYQVGKNNQKMANAEAERIRAMGSVEEAALRRQQDYQLGQQKVDLASSGRSGGTGAALQLAFQSRLEGERTALARRDGHIMQQDQRINEGRMMRAQGTGALLGSFGSAAGMLLNEASKGMQMPALG